MRAAGQSALCLWWCAGAVGTAATFTVAMTPIFTFEPAALEIGVGDTVVWTNEDTASPHDTVSTQGFWSSPLLDYGQTYSLTFPIPGTFPYVDSFYGDTGMTGTVVVLPAVTQPLLVGLAFVAGEGVQLTATNLVAGQTNILQISTNLVNWAGVDTNVATGSGCLFWDRAVVTGRQRFYRVLVPP